MGRSSVHVLACLVAASAMLAGCRPLYGDKSEKLVNPTRKKRPEEPAEAAAPIKYIEECTTNFRDEKAPRPDTPRSNALVDDGNTSLAQLPKAKDPASAAELIRGAIDKFRNALVKDPFNQEATLRLAIAYDMVQRKGCALALLKRISQFEANPTYRNKAKRLADEVADTPTMFKGYRKEAVAAVGR